MSAVTDEQIDELALEIEQQIATTEQKLAELPDFTYGANLRATASDHIVDLGDLDYDT